MKYFTLLIPVLFFISCSSSTSNEEEESMYPIQAGTWSIESPDNAVWTGAGSSEKFHKSAADTFFISDTTSHDLAIYREEGFDDNYFQIDFKRIEIPTDIPLLPTMTMDYPSSFVSNGSHRVNDDVTIYMNYDCSPVDAEEDIRLEYHEIINDGEVGDLTYVYQFESHGFVEAAQHIVCD